MRVQGLASMTVACCDGSIESRSICSSSSVVEPRTRNAATRVRFSGGALVGFWRRWRVCSSYEGSTPSR